MKNLMKSSVAFCLFCIATLSACNNAKKTVAESSSPVVAETAVTASSDSKLNGTWQLNYVTGPKIAFAGLYPDKKPTLVFALPSMEASGNSSCNGYSVKFTIEGNKISFKDPLSTMMACEGGGEQLYFKTLKQITNFSISDDTTLNLVMGDVAMMRFKKN